MNDMTPVELAVEAERKDKPKELVPVPPAAGTPVQALVPKDMNELKYYAGLVISGGIAPESYKNDPKKIALGIMKGMEVGLAPLMALSNIAIINGRPSIYGDAAMALVQSRNLIERIEETEIGTPPGEGAETHGFADDYGFEVKIWRRGQSAPYVGRFTVGDAKRAKLWMNHKRAPWMAYPRRMLKIRARTFPLRDGFADALSGLSIAEEVEDLPPVVERPDTSFLDDAPVEPTTEALAPPAEGDETDEPSELPAGNHPYLKSAGAELEKLDTKDAIDAWWSQEAENLAELPDDVLTAITNMRDERLSKVTEAA